jgi:hypothetical protein
MRPGLRVKHGVYGLGTIINVEDSVKMGDANNWPKTYQSSINPVTNGSSRYTGALNIAVKFDTGGPMGWAGNASNNIEELEVIDVNEALLHFRELIESLQTSEKP